MAKVFGGGILNRMYSTPLPQVFKDLEIGNNKALDGGGFYMDEASVGLELTGLIVEKNHAQKDGGFYFSIGTPFVVFNDSVIRHNIVDSRGAGGSCDGSFVLIARNLEFTNNSAGYLCSRSDLYGNCFGVSSPCPDKHSVSNCSLCTNTVCSISDSVHCFRSSNDDHDPLCACVPPPTYTLSDAAIIGIISGVLALLLVVFIIYKFYYYKRTTYRPLNLNSMD